MAKEKKKTPLPDGAIFNSIGIYFYEDIPKFHIDGVECSEEKYAEHLAEAAAALRVWQRGRAFKKIIKEISKEKNI